MFYNRMCVLVIASFVLFTLVKGSCLEYGHSCWGAHGKRSGNGAAGKILRAATNLRNNKNDDKNAAQNAKALFDSIDELNNPSENKVNSPQLNNDEELDGRNSANNRDSSKLRTLLLSENSRLRNRNRNPNDYSMEQEERFVKRWQKFPLFNTKTLTKPQLTHSENDLLQQPSKILLFDENLYYDFQ